MKNLGFRATTLAGFGAVISIFVVIIAICIFQVNKIQAGVNEAKDDVLPYEMLASNMAMDVVQVQQFLTDVSATHDLSGLADAEEHAKSFKAGISRLRQHYESSQEKIAEIDELDRAFGMYYGTGRQMADAYVTRGIDAGNEIMKRPGTGFDESALLISTRMAKFREAEVSATEKKVADVNAAAKGAIIISILSGLISLIAGMALAWKISGDLLNTIGTDPIYAKGIAREIADGDLTRDIMLNQGDSRSLLFAIRSMQLKLREIIREVTLDAEKISKAAHHLSDSAQVVLNSSQLQSSAATSVSGAVDQIKSSINQIAANAASSELASRNAGKVSSEGGKVVLEAAGEMRRIAQSVSESSQTIRKLGESSRNISDVINVIKDIAEQTNLLALNAAIEAARAGEHGRGFAVVADEVRSLASRTTQSTKEISEIVGEIQQDSIQAVASMEVGSERVLDGVEKANRAGSSMEQISISADDVARSVTEISGAISEQSSTMNMVANEVEMIANMVNENTLAVNDLAQTSSRLHELSRELNKSIGYFRV